MKLEVESKAEKLLRQAARARAANTFWPSTLEAHLNISKPTRWRWERDGKLPPRDVHVAGRTGWKRETIEAATKAA